jgi:hypothetical protein
MDHSVGLTVKLVAKIIHCVSHIPILILFLVEDVYFMGIFNNFPLFFACIYNGILVGDSSSNNHPSTDCMWRSVPQ